MIVSDDVPRRRMQMIITSLDGLISGKPALAAFLRRPCSVFLTVISDAKASTLPVCSVHHSLVTFIRTPRHATQNRVLYVTYCTLGNESVLQSVPLEGEKVFR